MQKNQPCFPYIRRSLSCLLTQLLFHVFHSPYSSDINSKVHKGEPPELEITFSAEYKSTSEKSCLNVLLKFISMCWLCVGIVHNSFLSPLYLFETWGTDRTDNATARFNQAIRSSCSQVPSPPSSFACRRTFTFSCCARWGEAFLPSF